MLDLHIIEAKLINCHLIHRGRIRSLKKLLKKQNSDFKNDFFIFFYLNVKVLRLRNN